MISESSIDLSAVAWVHDELRRSIDAAHKALRRFLKEVETTDRADLDVFDPTLLRAARAQLHQGVGALELVGLPAAALVLRASEALVQRAAAKPETLTTKIIADIERASFALLDYLGRMLAGKPVSQLSLFPQYYAVLDAAEASRVHPADLVPVEWRWRDLPADPGATPSAPSAATHDALENQLLALMRGIRPRSAAARISDICANLGAGATEPEVATLWRLASAMFEAQAEGLLGFDLFTKRVASRLLPQLRMLERGEPDVSERLARDLLFFCGQSKAPAAGRSPRLGAVRQAYAIADGVPVDYSVSMLGRFDPALIAHARKRVASAKEAWSAVAGGELHRLAGLSEPFALVGDSLKRLFPHGEALGAELQQAALQTQASQQAPAAPLAMEVATSLLYIEAALEDADFDDPEHPVRVPRLTDRLATVRNNEPPEPLEGWMEELYRRVSDRQTIGSVVQELRASLAEAEKSIDRFFRNPADPQVLIPVSQHLSAMRGVLSVLGMEHASAALLRMRDEIDGLASAQVDPSCDQPGLFDRIAGNLSALGFLIDMLGVQPQMAKSLFVYDAEAGTLRPVMGRSDENEPAEPASLGGPVEQRLIEQAQLLAFSSVREDVSLDEVARDLARLSHEAQAADQPVLAATVRKAQAALERADGEADYATVRGELSEALVDFVATAVTPAAFVPEPAPTAPQRLASASQLNDFDDDDEMREVFLEEAREVVGEAATASRELARAPDDLGLLTTLRRAFHTLKGSSRMVGLKDFGEAAWICEQLYNTHLAEQRAADPAFVEFTAWSLGHFGAWVDEIAAKQPVRHDSATVKAKADRLARQMPAPGIEGLAPPLGLPPNLPSAADLDFGTAAPVAARTLPAAGPQAAIHADADEAGGLGFELDLGALDAPSAPAEVGARRDAFAGRPTDLDLGDELPREPVISSLAPSGTVDDEPTEAPVPLPDEAIPELVLDLADRAEAFGAAADEEWAAARGPGETSAGADLGADRVTAEADALGAGAVPRSATELDDELAQPDRVDDEPVKVVGPLRIGIPLFNIYLNEADEQSRRLTTELAEWAMELHRPIGEVPVALAHSLAGSSATVGFADLSQLARALEHAQSRSQAIGAGTPDEAQLFVDAAEEIRRLLHQFAAGFLKAPSPELLERLAEHEVSSARRLDAATAAAEFAPVDENVGSSAGAEPVLDFDFDDDGDAEVDEPSSDFQRSDFQRSAFQPSDFQRSGFQPRRIGAPRSAFGGLQPLFDPLGLAALKPLGELVTEPRKPPPLHDEADHAEDDIDAQDAVDADLFPIFEEEGLELIPQLAGQLRAWVRDPADTSHAAACMRTLHTLKGGARLAGAMRLGEMAHRLETRIERILAHPPVEGDDVDALQGRCDGLAQTLESLRRREDGAAAGEVQVATAPAEAPMRDVSAPSPSAPTQAASAPAPAAPTGAAVETRSERAEETSALPISARAPARPAAGAAASVAGGGATVDWSRFADTGVERRATDRSVAVSQAAVRIGTPLLDRLVNLSGEVSITRSRVEAGVGQIKSSLADLTENLERLRGQLREIEIQGEMQMTSRLEAAKAAAQSFDPLEFDRFTRFQELTRMMAEAVNDVATVQRTLQRSLETTEDELVAQSRMTRDLQDNLLRTRMVEFEGLSDRLYRVVRQAAKETGKQVRLDIVGGSIEIDRGVLDRVTGAFEHLLRNCVTHGIEAPADRVAAGKDAAGAIVVALSHEGNEVGIEFRDDGAGLDLAKIRAKGLEIGLMTAESEPSDAELASLIFTPGFSTASAVTELAGRGVGMDVVRSDVVALGGRIETATERGKGTSFKLILPLTTAVTQVVMLRCGETTVGVPSTLIETVLRATPQDIEAAYASGTFPVGDTPLQFFWLGALLQVSPYPVEATGRMRSLVIIRSAQQRIAVQVDEVVGNQEVVVKNLGPQLSRLPGLVGMTLLASGAVALIYNPVALAALYGEGARAAANAALAAPDTVQTGAGATAVALAPLVLVVDDSLTVRRVTQRLLLREGFRVALAKDGLDALERLSEEVPAIVLSDIEMPRMDGFDLVRNIRSDTRLRDLPVIMITSRIAQKHRDHAAELGVDHYLGKPYSEEDLLALIARYTANSARA
ncbi:MAG: Hpt domain-containing protein [Caldimonas sp.]